MIGFHPLSIHSNDMSYTGRWRLVGETLELEIDGTTYCVESGHDLADKVGKLVRTLGRQVLRDDITLKACLNCQHFQMSGMAREMGRGQRGVCGLHRSGVEICHLCDDYEKGETKV
tara:strand:+ start:116 stop:463 length:348 start_codon:yes stop_codon:yes gene_type:complete